MDGIARRVGGKWGGGGGIGGLLGRGVTWVDAQEPRKDNLEFPGYVPLAIVGGVGQREEWGAGGLKTKVTSLDAEEWRNNLGS